MKKFLSILAICIVFSIALDLLDIDSKAECFGYSIGYYIKTGEWVKVEMAEIFFIDET